MNPEQRNPAALEALIRQKRIWLYPWIGSLLGVAVGILVGHPLAMVVHNINEFMNNKAPLELEKAIVDSFSLHMWPMTVLFALFGGVTWAIMGFIFKRLRENRLRLDAAHQELQRQARYLNTYLTVSSMVSQCLDPHELLEGVLNLVMETVTAEGASVLLLDKDLANFRFYSVEGPAKQCLMSATFPADKGIAGSVLQTQRSEVINDVHSDPRFYQIINPDYHFVTQNLIAIPLSAGEEKIGVIEVLNKAGGEPFNEEERLLLDSIAEEIAFAIRNAKIFEYVVNTYCKQRQAETSCRGCRRLLRSWTPCVKYLEKTYPPPGGARIDEDWFSAGNGA